MKLKDFAKIKEAAYLTAENATRYRMILHFFFVQHERMKDLLYPADIFHYMRSFKEMSDYTEICLSRIWRRW